MTSQPRLFLVDLTYDTVVISIEYFPIAMGYIGGYVEKCFPGTFDISLFKFSDQLEKALEQSQPDILALSFWPWNSNLTLEAIAHYREKKPDGLVVIGGANFPMDEIDRQKLFLQKHAGLIDICVHHDGEFGMEAVLEAWQTARGCKENMLLQPIRGCSALHSMSGELLLGEYIPRPVNIDTIPSPYLSGLMDPYFSNIKLTPLLQHTRGCPFTCSYCWAGNRRNGNIRQFSVERVCAELEYICQRRKNTANTNFAFADSNFGMYPSDEKIAEKVIELQQKYDYPGYFYTPYGKNRRDRVTGIVARLKNADAIISLQSTDPQILKNIRRENMSTAQCKELVTTLHEKNIAVKTEIITALPGETRATHLNTLRDVIDIGFDEVHPFTLMLLEGTCLTTPEGQRENQWERRYRILPRNFGKYRGNIVFEVETIAVGSKTFSFEDFIYTRTLHSIMRVVFNHTVFSEYIRYLKQYDADMFSFLPFFHQAMEKDHGDVGRFFAQMKSELQGELWEDSQALSDHFHQEENYAALVSGDAGENLLGKLKAVSIVTLYPQITRLYADAIICFLRDNHAKDFRAEEVEDIYQHLMAKGARLWERQEDVLTTTVSMGHDVAAWAAESFHRPLHAYRHPMVQRTYQIPPHGRKIRDEVLAQLSGTSGSLWKIVGSRVHLSAIFRTPVATS